MKLAVFSTKSYDERFLNWANEQLPADQKHELTFFEPRLEPKTVKLAEGQEAVCAFVNDRLDEETLRHLSQLGVRAVVLRCAGFNQVDLKVADELGIPVGRVPAYSPHGVAEHTVGLMLALNRKIHRAFARVREGNFELEGLLGFEMHGLTAGVIGTGKIGTCVAGILKGFGCGLLGHDLYPNDECKALGMRYLELDELWGRCDIISLHCPLTPQTHHLINAESIAKMKPGVMLINTGRGKLVDTAAVIEGLKTGRIGHVGLDVYEEEADLFFQDLSSQVIQDDVFARLLTFPNVVVTSHQAFFTENALRSIAQTTVGNLAQIQAGEECPNLVHAADAMA